MNAMKTAYDQAASPAPQTLHLEGTISAEVAVVGAGITGLSTALHLAEQGSDVAIVESHEIGWGASGRNGGQVNPGLKHGPDQIVRDFCEERGSRIVALAHGAADFVGALIDRLRIFRTITTTLRRVGVV